MATVSDAALEESNHSVFAFQGLFSIRDEKKYFQFPFEVEKLASKIIVRLEYSKEQGNTLYLQLYDYRKFRGIGKSREEGKKKIIEITVTPTHASAGAIFGNLPRGRWLAEIDTDEIATVCKYNLTVKVYYQQGRNNRFPIKKPKHKDRALSLERKWYKGDIHIHSSESDGIQSVGEVIQAAREAQLDFIAITDHNTISPWQYYKRYKDILLIPAVELTTHRGHANAIGIEDWVDWRLGYRNRTMSDIIKDTYDQGALFSINHPGIRELKGEDSLRMWNKDLERIDCVEIWNAPWTKYNAQANSRSRALWTQWLNEGYRLTAVAGSDLHSIKTNEISLGKLVNYVYSDSLSQDAILEAIKGGRVFLSIGPVVYFSVSQGNEKYMVGDTVPIEKTAPILFFIEIKGIHPGMEIWVVGNGQLLQKYEIQNESSFTESFEYSIREKGWYRVEIHKRTVNEMEDSLQAITNPIYFEK